MSLQGDKVNRAVGGWYPMQKRMSVPERRDWIMSYLTNVEKSVDAHSFDFIDLYFEKTGAPAEACLGVDLRKLVEEGRLAKKTRPTKNKQHPFHVRCYYIPEVSDD